MSDSAKGNASGMNLDLSDVTEPDEAASRIETFYKNDNIVKTQLAYAWERTQLMLDGKQWIVYEGNGQTGGMWKPLKVSKENEYIPRPVTNYMFDAYQTLKGYVLKSKPRTTVRPNSQSHRDKNAAKLATLVSETNYARLKEEQNLEYAMSCLVQYGTVFKKSYWDTSYVSQIEVPKTEIQPITDPQTGQVVGQQEVDVKDENGNPVTELLPLGDVNTDVIEPYRISIDPLASDLHKCRWIMEYSIQPLDWIKTVYGKGQNPEDAEEGEPQQPAQPGEEGFTGMADEVKPEQNLNNSLRRFFQLKTSSGVRGGAITTDTGMGAESYIENTAVVKEYYERPSQTYPKGRMIVVANGKCLYLGDSPCEGPELGDWHPYSEARWEIVAGRFWGKGPLDDAAETQKIINSIDATVILTRKTMAVPQKLIPMGLGVEPGKWTGRPGQEINYRADGTGSKPETIPGAGVDPSVFTERAQRVEDFKQITGAIDILKGDRPPGVTAASALSMLYEVGTGKLFPVLNRIKAFIENDSTKQLRLVAHGYREVRPEFIRAMKMRNTDLSDEEISQFIGEDLYDNCNVIIEAGSNVPKLQAAAQALKLEVAQTGALNLNMPANRSQFLQDLGIAGYDNDVGPDTRRAEWENDLMDSVMYSPDNQPVLLTCDNDQIHIEIHENRMKEPSFMALPSQVQQAYMQHTETHHEAAAKKQQQQDMQAMATGQPPTPPQPGARQAGPPLHSSGNGVPSKMKQALFSDALIPGKGTPGK